MLKSPVDTALLMSPFRIHSVVYADKDVTAMAMMKWVQGNRLIIDTNNLNNLILGPSAEAVDPWFGQPKTLAMLYSYGAEDRIFSVRAGVGIVTITRGRWDEAPYSDLCMNYSQDLIKWMKVIGIVWGPKIVKSGAVAQSVSQFAGLKKPWQFTNAMMGGDTWAGQGKTGVIWYVSFLKFDFFERGQDISFVTIFLRRQKHQANPNISGIAIQRSLRVRRQATSMF